MIIHRGKQQEGRQKPRQWGPLSAVRDAVRYNCERLGLPVPIHLWAMWEGSGGVVRDVFGNDGAGASLGNAWTPKGIDIAGDAGKAPLVGNVMPRITNKLTIISIGSMAAGPSAWRQLFSNTNVDSSFLFGAGSAAATLRFVVDDGTTTVAVAAPSTFSPSKGYIVAGVYDGAGLTIYSAGRIVGGPVAVTGNIVDRGRDFRIGGMPSNANSWQGFIYSTIIFNEALTADQIALLHAQPYAMLEPIPRLRVFQGPIEISTQAGLEDISLDLTASYILVNDITLTGNWTPLGPLLNGFTGILDGDGHFIENLTLAASTGSRRAMFAYASDCTIKNLWLKDVSNLGRDYAAGLIGYILNGTEVILENIKVTGDIQGRIYVGGIVARVASTRKLTMNNCYNQASLSHRQDATATSIAGLVGLCANADSVLTNCYNTGLITPWGTQDGFGVARMDAGTLTSCYFDSQTSGQVSQVAGGTPKTTANMKKQATFTDWNFTTIWSIDEDVDYPRLRVFQADEGFVLISPADTTSGLTKPVTLTWTAVVEATHYRLEIAETADTDFASPVKSELLETNEYSITDLPAAWYRWRVRYRM